MLVWERKSISSADAVSVSATSRITSMKLKVTSPGMARSRSPRKQVVPFRIPRRNTSESPASFRIVLPSLSTWLAIRLAVNFRLILTFFGRAIRLRPDLIQHTGGIGHLEGLRDRHSSGPDDFIVPKQQGDLIA